MNGLRKRYSFLLRCHRDGYLRRNFRSYEGATMTAPNEYEQKAREVAQEWYRKPPIAHGLEKIIATALRAAHIAGLEEARAEANRIASLDLSRIARFIAGHIVSIITALIENRRKG